jgi:hypothetical protein
MLGQKAFFINMFINDCANSVDLVTQMQRGGDLENT